MDDATLGYTCDEINEAVGKGLKLPNNISDSCGCFLKITDDGKDISAPVEIIGGNREVTISPGTQYATWEWGDIPFKDPSSNNQNNVFGVIQPREYTMTVAEITKDPSGYTIAFDNPMAVSVEFSFEYILFKYH